MCDDALELLRYLQSYYIRLIGLEMTIMAYSF